MWCAVRGTVDALVRRGQPLKLSQAAGQGEDGVQALVAQPEQGHGHLAQRLVARRHELADIQERIDAATKELKTVKSTGSAADWYRVCIGQYAEAGDHAERELLRLLVARIVAHGDALTVEWTDYAQSIVNATDGSPSRRPAAGTLRLRST